MFEKRREHRVRRLAARYGFALEKSWRVDPDSKDYEHYMIVLRDRRNPIFGAWPHRFSADLDEVENWLRDFGEKAQGS